MKYFRGIIIVVITLSLLFFGGIFYCTVSWLKRPRPTKEIIAGKEIYQQYACMQCHSLLSNADYLSSDLTHVITYRSRDWVRDFFANRGGETVGSLEDAGVTKSRHPELDLEEIEALLEFLTYVDKYKSREHPLKPKPKIPVWY